MMPKITSESHGPRTLLMAPAQQQEETILAEGTGVVPAKCSPKIISELFSLLQSAREGKLCVPFFVMALGFYSSRAGPSFPWSRSPFLIGILLWAYFAGSFPYRICSQVYPKRGEQVIPSLFGREHQEIPTWHRQHILMLSPCVPSASGTFSLSAVGLTCFFSPTTPSFRTLMLPSAIMNPYLTAPFHSVSLSFCPYQFTYIGLLIFNIKLTHLVQKLKNLDQMRRMSKN